jgi:hypothetical protein
MIGYSLIYGVGTCYREWAGGPVGHEFHNN